MSPNFPIDPSHQNSYRNKTRIKKRARGSRNAFSLPFLSSSRTHNHSKSECARTIKLNSRRSQEWQRQKIAGIISRVHTRRYFYGEIPLAFSLSLPNAFFINFLLLLILSHRAYVHTPRRVHFRVQKKRSFTFVCCRKSN